MIKAGFTTESGAWPWQRQFSSNKPIWDDVEFIFDGDLSQCDVVFSYGHTLASHPDGFPVKRAVFISGEPWTFKSYRSRFLAQFDIVLTTDPNYKRSNAVFGQPALPWHVGVYRPDGKLSDSPLILADLRSYSPPKSKLVSVVASDKMMTRGHRTRLQFVEKLKRHFGTEMDFYGRNVNGFGDKTEVLADYRYHVALENYVGRHYWTEKLSDPILTLTYPIYAGCTNINDYLDGAALTSIDMRRPDEAIATIRKVIDSDLAERAQPALVEARNSILDGYNLFAVLSRLAKKACSAPPRPRRLLPENRFRRDLLTKVRKTFANI